MADAIIEEGSTPNWENVTVLVKNNGNSMQDIRRRRDYIVLAINEHEYVARLEGMLRSMVDVQESPYLTKDMIHDLPIDFSKHECGCEVCARSSKLCPATTSSIISDIGMQARALLTELEQSRKPKKGVV